MASLLTRTAAPLLGLATLAALGLAAKPVSAQTQIFDLTYAGINGSNAVATGTIILDESKIQNPGNTFQSSTPFVTAFNLTVTGAGFGNGTFTLADYNEIFLETNGGTLDFTKELVGQPTTGDPFGTRSSGGGGDFNLFTNSIGSAVGAPNGTNYFTLSTSNGNGSELGLTSFTREAPAVPNASAAPEPSQFAGLSFIVLGLGGVLLRARRRKA